MRIKLFIMLAGASLSSVAAAQGEPDVLYDGKWTATISANDGTRQVTPLVLKDFAGTWQGATAKAPCKGKPAPITIQQSTATALAFTVWGKTVGQDCRDLTIVLKPVTAKEMEGTVESVGTIKLVRR